MSGPFDDRFRLALPSVGGDANLRELDRWGNTLPLDLPHVLRIGVIPSTGRSTTSTSYVDWPVTDVASASFVKRHGALTKLEFLFLCTAYCNTGTPVATFGVKLTRAGTSTDYDLTKYAFNAAADHRTIVGATTVKLLPAGLYTVTLRAKINTNTLQVDGNDYQQLIVSEVMDLPEQ